jgi:hypothetical protein
MCGPSGGALRIVEWKRALPGQQRAVGALQGGQRSAAAAARFGAPRGGRAGGGVPAEAPGQSPGRRRGAADPHRGAAAAAAARAGVEPARSAAAPPRARGSSPPRAWAPTPRSAQGPPSPRSRWWPWPPMPEVVGAPPAMPTQPSLRRRPTRVLVASGVCGGGRAGCAVGPGADGAPRQARPPGRPARVPAAGDGGRRGSEGPRQRSGGQ